MEREIRSIDKQIEIWNARRSKSGLFTIMERAIYFPNMLPKFAPTYSKPAPTRHEPAPHSMNLSKSRPAIEPGQTFHNCEDRKSRTSGVQNWPVHAAWNAKYVPWN